MRLQAMRAQGSLTPTRLYLVRHVLFIIPSP
jgi:hypothetical protein